MDPAAKRMLLALPFLIFSLCLPAQKVTFAIGEWPPFTGEVTKKHGFMSEIVVAACTAAGLEASFVFVPWARAEKMVKDGQAFATFPYSITDERRADFDFSDPLYVSVWKIHYFEGIGRERPWSTLQDLNSATFGAVRGWYYLDALMANGISFEMTESLDSALAMLRAGRFEYLIEDEIVCMEAFRQRFPKDAGKLKTLSKPYDTTTLALMVSRSWPGSPALLARFDMGLAEIRSKGMIKAILAEHGLPDAQDSR